MPGTARRWLALLALLAAAGTATAQDLGFEDRPKPFVPLHKLTAVQRDHRESLKYYALGMLCQCDDRLLEAVAAFEKAAALHPTAAPVHKALVPLYLALERHDDALRATRKVLELDPDDFRTWYVYARQLRARNEFKDAGDALERALGCPAVKDHADLKYQLHVDLGALHERAGNLNRASKELKEAAALLDDPENVHEFAPLTPEEVVLRVAEIHERVGRIALQQKNYAEALTAFRKAQARSADGAGRLNFNLAQVSVELGKLAEAIGYLDAYLKLQPQSTEPYEMKLTLLRRLKRTGEILPWLETASAADRYNERLKLLLAQEYGRGGKSAAAEKIYTELAAQSPREDIYKGLFALHQTDPRLSLGKALTLLDVTFLAAGDVQNPARGLAAAQGRAMLAAIRSDKALGAGLLRAAAPMLEGGTRFTQETLHLLAVMAEREQQPEQAERFYRQSLKLATEDVQPLIYGGLLRVLWKGRKYEEVVQVCRDALRTAKEPGRLLYYSELARGLARLEKFDEAVREADNAVKVAGADEQLTARHLRVRIFVQAKQYEKAEAECLQLLKEHTQPGEVLEIRYLLSAVYSGERQLGKAEEQLEQCLKLDPDNATVNNDLGYIWADQNKNLAEAETMVRKAIELDRRSKKPGPFGAAAEANPADNAAYVDSLGWVLFRKGDLAGARKELERATGLPDSEDPVIYDHLGDVYLRLNLKDRARSMWERARLFYEREPRGTIDRRYIDLREKLKLLETGTQP